MYAEYRIIQLPDDDEQFTFERQCSLFGCNVGWIPRLLAAQMPRGQGEPYQWHLPIRELQRKEGRALVIDLKPRNVDPPLLTLFELEDVWGVSDAGWTPLMFRMRALFVDEDPGAYDQSNFRRSNLTRSDIVYTFLYTDGTIRDGAISGRWVPPRASPTNSALLWPKVFEYFSREVASLSLHDPRSTLPDQQTTETCSGAGRA